MGFRLLPEAEAELDDIWLYVARESGSVDIAIRLIDSITGRFRLLAQHRKSGAGAMPIYGLACVVLILHVMRGSRDLAGCLRARGSARPQPAAESPNR